MKKALLLLILLSIGAFSFGCYPVANTIIDNDQLDVLDHGYFNQIAEGNIVGHYPWYKNGYNEDVGTTLENIWPLGSIYQFPIVQQRMRVISDSANDVAGSTGASQIKIYYLDSLFNEHSTIVSCNGTSAVNTAVSDIYRIQHLRTIAYGANERAVGNIRIQDTTGSVTYGVITAGYGKDRMMSYTVPNNKALYITDIKLSSGSGNRLATIRTSLSAKYNFIENIPATTWETFFEMIIQDNAIYSPITIPIKLTEGSDFTGAAVSDVTGAKVFLSVRGWLEDD